MTRQELYQQLDSIILETHGERSRRYARALHAANAKVAGEIDRRSQRATVRMVKRATSWADGVFQAGAL